MLYSINSDSLPNTADLKVSIKQVTENLKINLVQSVKKPARIHTKDTGFCL